ncbi:MAG TPA: hypothetical protein VMU14_15845 [Acidimicrobiales bacterium]|nr:hypothetical protein [Acidimicrobiales bacterium]
MRTVAVDWSGARSVTAQRRAIWVAEAADGVLVRLEGGLTRDEATAVVLRRLAPGVLAGFDFSFSFPAWFVHAMGAVDGPGAWEAAARDGEAWLAACAPPFWGRRGRPRPAPDPARPEWRRTELGCAPQAASPLTRPKSTFQVGGAGSVGTGAVRGMPLLRRLREAGAAVWPFDAAAPSGPVVAEVYPRWATGPVVKSQAAARAAHVAYLGAAVPPRLRALAEASEDAFDAACTAVALSVGACAFPATDGTDAVEGRIFPVPLAGGRGRPAPDASVAARGSHHSP